MSLIQRITQQMLDELSAQAASSPRRRKNRNFHTSDEDACHRLLNAMEPGTYIQPHHHAGEGKDETVALLRGRLGLVEFDGDGGIVATTVLEPGGDTVAVHIPRGTIHTWVVLEKGCVFLESKAGPYRPFTPGEQASWAPAENSPGAPAYLASLERLFPGRPG